MRCVYIIFDAKIDDRLLCIFGTEKKAIDFLESRGYEKENLEDTRFWQDKYGSRRYLNKRDIM